MAASDVIRPRTKSCAGAYDAAVSDEGSERVGGRQRTWWIVAAAAVAVAIVAVVLVAVLQGGDDGDAGPSSEPTTSASSASPTSTEAPATTAPATDAPSTSPPTTQAPATTAPTSAPATTPGLADRTSPVDFCSAGCETVDYAADGLPIAYDGASKTLTVLEPTPRAITLDIAESTGRLIAVGPDAVVYLLVESTDADVPGRIIAVATAVETAGTVHEVVGRTNGLGSVFVDAGADGIGVTDCCGVGVADGVYPYVDSSGSALPGDPTLATWSWEWPVDSPMIVRNAETGETFEVPQQIPEREGLRSGNVRPLLDGRVVMLVDDADGALTAWALTPDSGSWTSTKLGNVLVEAIDPAGAALIRDQSTLAYDLVPLS
jgi:hypothetical protein